MSPGDRQIGSLFVRELTGDTYAISASLKAAVKTTETKSSD